MYNIYELEFSNGIMTKIQKTFTEQNLLGILIIFGAY